MEITFSDSKLQKLCEQSAIAQKKLGKDCARKLRSRLADLDAASSVQDLVTGRPHPLKGDRLGQFALDLQGGKRPRLRAQQRSDSTQRRRQHSLGKSNRNLHYIYWGLS